VNTLVGGDPVSSREPTVNVELTLSLMPGAGQSSEKNLTRIQLIIQKIAGRVAELQQFMPRPVVSRLPPLSLPLARRIASAFD
jgi:hypothetical protein